MPSNVEMDIRIFVTGDSPNASVQALNEMAKEKGGRELSDALSESEEKSGSASDHEGEGAPTTLPSNSLEAHPAVLVEAGRPVIGEILKEEITAVTGSVSVIGMST